MSSNCTSEPRSPRCDYHVHPDYSTDARGTIDDHCRRAVEFGLDEICLTTHYDADPAHRDTDGWVLVRGRRQPMDRPWLDHYLADIAAARERFAPLGLAVKAGLEVGYFEGADQLVQRLRAAHQFDYILGSVHWVDGSLVSVHESVRRWLRAPGRAAALAQYYARLTCAADSGVFDCLGHLDIYRRSLRSASETDLDHSQVAEAVAALFDACVRRGVGIEINTRDAGAGPEVLAPGQRLLGLAVRAGVQTITTGSDAHTPADVGHGLEEGLRAARAAGVSELSTFNGGRQHRHPLSS